MRSAKPRSRELPVRFPRIPMISLPRLVSGLVVALVVLGGCGGGSGGSGGGSGSSTTGSTQPDANVGKAAVSIAWPSSSGRSVPVGANSIRLTLLQNGSTLQTTVAARPADGSPSVVSFANLPLGALALRLDAYASNDGSGSLLATGTMTIDAVDGTPTPTAASLDPVVASLAFPTKTTSVGKGATVTLSVGATDATGTAILLPTGGMVWTSDAPGVATVSGNGATATVTGVAVGTTTVHATLTRADGAVVAATIGVTVSDTGGTVTIH